MFLELQNPKNLTIIPELEAYYNKLKVWADKQGWEFTPILKELKLKPWHAHNTTAPQVIAFYDAEYKLDQDTPMVGFISYLSENTYKWMKQDMYVVHNRTGSMRSGHLPNFMPAGCQASKDMSAALAKCRKLLQPTSIRELFTLPSREFNTAHKNWRNKHDEVEQLAHHIYWYDMGEEIANMRAQGYTPVNNRVLKLFNAHEELAEHLRRHYCLGSYQTLDIMVHKDSLIVSSDSYPRGKNKMGRGQHTYESIDELPDALKLRLTFLRMAKPGLLPEYGYNCGDNKYIVYCSQDEMPDEFKAKDSDEE